MKETVSKVTQKVVSQKMYTCEYCGNTNKGIRIIERCEELCKAKRCSHEFEMYIDASKDYCYLIKICKLCKLQEKSENFVTRSKIMDKNEPNQEFLTSLWDLVQKHIPKDKYNHPYRFSVGNTCHVDPERLGIEE